MNSEVFVKSRGMKPLSKQVAKLKGFELVFDQKGFPVIEPAFASIQDRDDGEVWGVLYELRQKDYQRLHCTEGYHYQECSIEVEGNINGQVKCSTYVGLDSKQGLNPSLRYLDKLVRGAVEHGLPETYINKLKVRKSTYVPLISELAGLVMKLALWYTSKGRTINLIVGRSGAKKSASEQENVQQSKAVDPHL